jgi:hexosaminidase
MPLIHSRLRGRAPAAILALTLAACTHSVATTSVRPARTRPPYAVVPAPAMIDISPRDSFRVTDRTAVLIDSGASPEIQAIGDYTANLIASRAGATSRRFATGTAQPDSTIALVLDPSRTNLGAEGYELTATRAQVRIVAAQPAGLFYGVQTLRQLLPPSVEHQAAMNRKLSLPAVHVIDTPRFAWRGGMLDVSRHFLPPADVKRFVDLYALYKLNRLHLHLSDDQGWRIQINSWPRLTEISGHTAIGDAPAGFYTQQEYADIVAYARSRYVTVVPEIDMPGHINSALLAYPDLKCDRIAPPPFTRVGGPPNSLCVTRDSVYQFVGDVVREIAAAAPTPYFHIGGDEVQRMSKEDYRNFITRVEQIVNGIGPRMIGWGEIAPVNLSPRTIAQHWSGDSVQLHGARGGQIILSPGPHAYLDMKYDSSTALGLMWAGLIDLHRAYDWDPGTLIPGVSESSILGVEGPLWAETLLTRADYEYMAFPRLAAIAELGWSPAKNLSWENFRARMAEQGARLSALGVNFARVPGVDWSW